jgi:hypothetical protein
MIFCNLLLFFKKLVKIKIKEKGEKLLSPQFETAQGGYVNGFMSLWRLDEQFHYPWRKIRFDPKLREIK